MGFIDLFKKREQQKSTTAIKIGDWVTQYSVGYWKVVDIFPKYADGDYNYEGKSWKKGDRLGNWVILKKGFTANMKPRNDCELIDAQWCNPVSADILQAINEFFEENPKAKQKFDQAPSLPKPSVASAWMKLSDEQADTFTDFMSKLPERFNKKQFWEYCAEYRQYLVDSSQATHILYTYSYLWEIDENFEPLGFGPEIKKL